MKHITIFIILLITGTMGIQADTFSSRNIALQGNTTTSLRGVINQVYLPVPDDLELGAVQSGYFLFTPDQYTITVKDSDSGKKSQIKNQQMSHLTASEEDAKQFEATRGKPVEVKARLIQQNTRYHRTPIILEVLSIKEIKT